MSFGQFRLFSAISASAFCFWKRAECMPSDQSTTKEAPTKPTYDDYFMAAAFLASIRSKDPKTKVGACIATTDYPHRLVGLGYNGMPDGSGFKDLELLHNWKSDRKHDFVCHAEMNAIISAFRRQADLTKCTLYTTHSPCRGCSKLIAQSGIKNIVYAKAFKKGDDMRKHLAHLPALNVKHYEYLGDERYGKIVIDLEKIKASQHRSLLKVVEEDKRKEEVAIGWSLGDYLSKDDFFMSMAILATIRSKIKNPVGACLVTTDPHRAISIGYNGLPDFSKQNYAAQEEDEYGEVCHAESNAIIGAFRYHADLKSSILYSTSPLCFECAKIIVQSGVKTVIYAPMEDVCTHSCDEDLKRAAAVEKMFYRARIPYLKYQKHTPKSVIVIDLKNHFVEQRVRDDQNSFDDQQETK